MYISQGVDLEISLFGIAIRGQVVLKLIQVKYSVWLLVRIMCIRGEMMVEYFVGRRKETALFKISIYF
jgi:hypothetical protein